jgi:hypothetical protein
MGRDLGTETPCTWNEESNQLSKEGVLEGDPIYAYNDDMCGACSIYKYYDTNHPCTPCKQREQDAEKAKRNRKGKGK